MSKITNKPTKTDETTLALRGLCAKRASTICYMIQQAKEHGVQDGAAFAREAITKYGEDIGQVVKSKMKDPDDLLEFSQYFGAGRWRSSRRTRIVFIWISITARMWRNGKKWAATRRKWRNCAISPWRATGPWAPRLTHLSLHWARPSHRAALPARSGLTG